MFSTRTFIAFGITVFLLGCGASMEEKNKGYKEVEASADSIDSGFMSSSAAVEDKKDTTRKFIRTADLKFKVKSVINSTYDIENITARHGGFVTYTNLASTINNIYRMEISEDSLMEIKLYTVSNSITLRIPNTKLDTTLKDISKNIDYLDYRVIKADDVALQILSNNLTQSRSAKNEQRLTNAIDNRGKKMHETTLAEEALTNKQEQADNAKIANLSLNDQISFSTITIEIYQRQTGKQEIIPIIKSLPKYEPGFGKKCKEAIKFGWVMLETLIFFFIHIWTLIFMAIAGVIIYKRYIKKKKDN